MKPWLAVVDAKTKTPIAIFKSYRIASEFAVGPFCAWMKEPPMVIPFSGEIWELGANGKEDGMKVW